jgi:hypothetical protein
LPLTFLHRLQLGPGNLEVALRLVESLAGNNSLFDQRFSTAKMQIGLIQFRLCCRRIGRRPGTFLITTTTNEPLSRLLSAFGFSASSTDLLFEIGTIDGRE